jgi:2-alkyl-3-oxoalkanoate reductase
VIFLTGGTGLIGSHVAEQLRGRNMEVVALVRKTSDTRHLERVGCRIVEGDVLGGSERLAAAMRDCHTVIHAAALVFERAGRKKFRSLNVVGTERVLQAAALAAPRVVHVSSVAVYSRLPYVPSLTEDRWVEADPKRQGAYAASKTESERLAWDLHDRGSIRLTTVRPAVVYGERDRAATPLMLRLARLPAVPLPGGGRTRLPLVYAGNVARGVLATLDREAAMGRAYNLAEDHPVSAREMARLLAEAVGRKARVLTVPTAPLRALTAGLYQVTHWAPLPTADFRRGVNILTRDNPYDSSRARVELGWIDLMTHEEAVRRTVTWWRAAEGDI